MTETFFVNGWCVKKEQTAFRNRLLTISINNNLNYHDPNLFLRDASFLFPILLKKINFSSCKINSTFVGKFIIPKGDEDETNVESELKFLNTRNTIFLETMNALEWYHENIYLKLIKKFENFVERNSGWALTEIIKLDLKFNKCNLFSSGSGGGTFIDLPKEIKRKKACVNIFSDDEYCFGYAVGASLQNVTKNVNIPSSYKHFRELLNLDGITFPFTIDQLEKFESQNDISINIFALKENKDNWFLGDVINIENSDEEEEEILINENNTDKVNKSKYEILPVRIAETVRAKHTNLLLLQNKNNDNSEFNKTPAHFVYIKNFSRLISSQQSKRKSKLFFCDRCLSYFYNQQKLDNHVLDCRKFKGVKTVLPTQLNNKISFKKYKYKQWVPFIVYFDLETYLEPICGVQNSSETSYTNPYSKHVCYSIAFLFKCNFDNSLSFLKFKQSPDCIDWFLFELKSIAELVANIFNTVIEMKPLTQQEIFDFNNSTHCCICEKSFAEGELKVHHHDHFTSMYVGAAHRDCNILYQTDSFIPVVSHNLSGYDSHFIIQKLCTLYPGKVSLLPFNKEKYKSFTKTLSVELTDKNDSDKDTECFKSIRLRFIDSLQFMSQSLDVLSSSLESYPITKHYWKDIDTDDLNLLLKKGVFPYNYITSLDTLEETCLPEKSKFFNDLKNEPISDEAYQHALKVWGAFNCSNLGEYSKIYLITDVLLLAEVFESFRTLCFQTYNLDAAHFITAPSLSWFAMLRITKVEIELLTDVDKLLMIEKGIRGGLSNCTLRYASANNKYLPNYDIDQESVFLTYLDLNNLYGYSQIQYLPLSNFCWLTSDEILELDILSIASDSNIGYILEVDLHYPQSLHDEHSDLPFLPDHTIPPGGKIKKLLATLYDKEKYVIHYRMLQACINHGIKLLKIHRVIKFEQSPWMRTYIELNTKLRTTAKTSFQTDFYKLMNNAVFGKTLQNMRKMRDIRICSKYDGAYGVNYYISKPNFYDRLIFDENCTAVEMKRCKILFDKPIIIGFTILDLSKILLYTFHYDFMKTLYARENITLCYTDTDSLIYQIKTNDIYADFKPHLNTWFDTSGYKPDNPYGYPLVNKKVMGVIKDEMNGEILEEFLGLRSKMYAIKVHKREQSICKAKGITKGVRKHLSILDYKACLFKKLSIKKQQHIIRSIKHNVYTCIQNKTALDFNDDKRFIQEDGLHTLAWGHYSIKN